jgi:hypothetical protein
MLRTHYIMLNFSSKSRFFSSTTIAPMSSWVGTQTCAFTDASVVAERAERSYLLAICKASRSSSSSVWTAVSRIEGREQRSKMH